jgi:hypothetical protein
MQATRVSLTFSTVCWPFLAMRVTALDMNATVRN